MYYVPEGTKTCGYYECKKCGNRFLSMQTMSRIPCPDCAAEIDYEIGPDETMEDVVDTAVLLEKIEGEEEVARMDALLSLAVTGGKICLYGGSVSQDLLSGVEDPSRRGHGRTVAKACAASGGEASAESSERLYYREGRDLCHRPEKRPPLSVSHGEKALCPRERLRR